ncbi:MAG: ribosome-associated translation inhibitor RaiA [Bacilli bacterium]|nr:ribosome-associated translation inhibitor RaiA [Bacilli bacterium]MDD4077400.1 ribosome-associated translation inhibitor RaiA [Bacilli bacterium]
MKVIVRGKNKFKPSEAIKQYVTDKLQKVEQYFTKNQELEANVLCKVYDTHQTVEITIPTKHIILRAEAKNQTIYGAIDLAIDKLESQIRKHKSKIYKSLKRREGVAHYYSDKNDFDLDKMKTEIIATNLVKEKRIDLKPMTVDDAILQMEMLGHDFFIFLNSENNKVSVVYLREDQNYGIIETSQQGDK